MNNETNKPLDTIRDGILKATIWKNPGKDDKPPFYSVRIIRSYKDEKGSWHDTDSFSGAELLRVSHLADITYSEFLIHKAKYRAGRDVTGTAA